MTVFAAILKGIPLGCQNLEIPSCILKNKKIFCLSINSSHKPYNDNLCLLRAVAFHLTGKQNLEEWTANLFQRFLEHCKVDINDFDEVTLEAINDIEDLTELNISIYEIEVENDQLVGVLSRRSINKHSRSVTLLSYQNHICYTKDLCAVFNCFRCENCNTFFQKHANLRRHLPVCSEKVREKFPNSAYRLKETVFENFRNLELQFQKITNFLKILQFLISNQFAWRKTIPCQTTQLHGWVSMSPFPYQYLLTFSKVPYLYVTHNLSKW